MPIRPDMLDRYPADWKLRSRFIRHIRARNRCEWCGVENGKKHPITGSRVVLTCAHIFDDRPEAASLLNLAALCQRCHNRHDAASRAQGRRERREAASGQMRLFDHTILPTPRKRFSTVWKNNSRVFHGMEKGSPCCGNREKGDET